MSAYERHLAAVRREAREYQDRAPTLLAYVAKCQHAQAHNGRFRLGTSDVLHASPYCVGRAGITIEPYTLEESIALMSSSERVRACWKCR